MSDAEGYQAIAESEVEAASHRPQANRRNRLRLPLMIGVPVVILLVAAYFILTSGRFESTDDAYVQQARTAISASVPGRVIEIDVTENQQVKKGQVLFKLDPADLAVAEAGAEADLASARYEVQALKAAYRQKLADVAAAQEALAYAERESTRQQKLAAAGVSSKAQADEARHTADQARRQLAIANQAVASALADLGGEADAPIKDHPKVRRAEAALAKSKLDLSYAAITAPMDGVVAKVEQLQVGARVDASQTLFWLISGRPWVEANFKESQLAHMRVGQPVDVKIDAFDHNLQGHVASFSPGTGASFALLPPENATGNWVKVVQRLPVRIALDGKVPPLGAGLSANVKVDVRGASAE